MTNESFQDVTRLALTRSSTTRAVSGNFHCGLCHVTSPAADLSFP